MGDSARITSTKIRETGLHDTLAGRVWDGEVVVSVGPGTREEVERGVARVARVIGASAELCEELRARLASQRGADS